MPSHILVLGATGQTGIDFCNLALSSPHNHTLTLYARNPTKVPEAISSNSNVTIIKGTLEDEVMLKIAASCGAKIFVSFAGPTGRLSGTPVTDGMKLLFPLLIQNKFRRALILGTCSFPAPPDKPSWKWSALVTFVKVIGGSAYSEFNSLGEFVTSQDVDKIKWTLFRVPFLGNGEEKAVTATFAGSGEDGMFLSRKSIAAWVLSEMGEDSEWVGKAPVLCN
ncbi:hypothetical protein L207DRAFT_307892 [Hyaloscypha variabilis F]|uniref:NAD(P)-binding domain-containing protein n=1 Tax=Hyaloscypha variabilis (strain UAMH 11265 / GT02V1 / F) TaxID=1149755 RepID=A0A2J6RUS1_HYAVF|nr:hypothetical protein L207DRAFT_307892 [Hyaloscypha variabilis F]